MVDSTQKEQKKIEDEQIDTALLRKETNASQVDANKQGVTGTYTPKYIWKHTELDGNLPIANFTSDVKFAQKKSGNTRPYCYWLCQTH